MQKDGCPESNSEVLVPCASTTKTGEDADVSSYSEMKIEPGEYSSDTSPEDGKPSLVKGPKFCLLHVYNCCELFV